MKKILFSLASLLVFVPFVSVLAEEVGDVESEEIKEYFFLELIGVIVAAWAIYNMVKIYKLQSQGALGAAFRYYVYAMVVIGLSLFWRGVSEIMEMEDLFINELIYELSISAMLILISVGTGKASKILTNLTK